LALAHLSTPFHGVSLGCPGFVLDGDRIGCRDGRLRFAVSRGAPVQGRVSFDYRRAQNGLVFSLTDLVLAGGNVALRGESVPGGWTVQLDAAGMEAGPLIALSKSVLTRGMGQFTAEGRCDISATLSGGTGVVNEIQFQVDASKLGLADEAGRYSIADLDMGLKGTWTSTIKAQPGGHFAVDLEVARGSVYAHPFFLEPPDRRPIIVGARGHWEGQRLKLDTLRFHHPQVLRFDAALILDLGEAASLRQADVTVQEASFPAAYSDYVQPLVANNILGELEVEGRVAGRMAYDAGRVTALELDAAKLRIQDVQGRFGIEDLNTRVSWRPDAEPRRSTLRWRRGHAYRLAIGPGKFTLESRGESFRLLGQERIPLVDGAVIVERLEGRVDAQSLHGFQWQFDGLLTPVSLEALSAALEWPPLAGKLSGVVPGVRYRDHRLEVGGALLIRIFGGDITVTHLRVEELFSSVPKVYAQLDVRDLDLLALTQSFDFGKIEGKLQGSVRDLRMENWEPTQFDAVFSSPEAEQTRRRISQRAVENISALSGGGVTQALSRGILGMFKAFRYKRLGIRCRLVKGTCEMGGVAPAGQGSYYLVEGEGLPRIDVIGYTRRVDWSELLTRLKAATQSESPMVR
jgi:hypothetical protein